MAEMKIPQRSEISSEFKWRLEDVYPSDKAFEDAISEAGTYPEKIEAFRGKIAASAEELLAYLRLDDEITEKMRDLLHYANRKSDEDTRVSLYSGYCERTEALLTAINSAAAFAVPEILTISDEKMEQFIHDNNIPCPDCGGHDFTPIRHFNLMFKTFQGTLEDAKNTIYLRPETAQGMFVQFKNVQRAYRKKLPFGIGQIGKSFRNEITPGNFIFRTREFEQMEMEFFCEPGTDMKEDGSGWFQYWRQFCMDWILSLGGNKENLRFRDHEKEELSFYSKGTTDIEYKFPWGWGELWGIADRTNYDLTQHQNTSGKDLTYLDPTTNEKFLPYVVEPAVGVERLFFMFFTDAYDEETLENGDTRIVMHFHPVLAPIKAAVLPLKKKAHSEKAQEIYKSLSYDFAVAYDDAGSIGKRYRRMDEVGTPYCITVDDQTLEDGTVTIRNRDTMEQERLSVEEVRSKILGEIRF